MIVPTIKQPENADDHAAPTDPLAPPPVPNQNGENSSHLSKEPNPFENAFGNPAETPGKTQLPGVTSLTSPASLLPGITPGWPGSLRAGPLSPAMLTGPTGSNDYFNSDHHFAGSFPTPTESSLRTGLTPGGGGSMFPQPSPNSQALYNQLQSGGATPGTLDFHRTAMTARAQNNTSNYNGTQDTSAAQPIQNPNIQPDLDSKPYNSKTNQSQQDGHDPFGSHQTTDAANGLFMLAQAGGQQQRRSQGYPMPQQPQQQQQQQQQSQQAYQQGSAEERGVKKSTEAGEGQHSDEGESRRLSRNGRGKKNSTSKPASNGKRKTEDTPSKVYSNKKQRASMGSAMSDDPDDDDMDQDDQDEIGTDGKKMTDEEKRKNFLERNRYVDGVFPSDLVLCD